LARTNELLLAKNKLAETLESVRFLASIAENIQDPLFPPIIIIQFQNGIPQNPKTPQLSSTNLYNCIKIVINSCLLS